MPLSPQTNSIVVAQLNENRYQNAPRYPVISAAGDALSSYGLRAVTLLAITALVASPTLLPICAIVLNTPPARACVLGGKTDVMTRFDTVNSASAPAGLKKTARNAHLQYIHSGWMIHMRRLATEVMHRPMVIAQFALTLCATKPMMMFESAPLTGAGRNLMDV